MNIPGAEKQKSGADKKAEYKNLGDAEEDASLCLPLFFDMVFFHVVLLARHDKDIILQIAGKCNS